MQLEVQSAWSVDLNPPDGGMPEDLEDFEVSVQLSIGEVGHGGGEVFSLVVCSASALCRVESGGFVTATLVLERFDWEAVRARVGKLLRNCDPCQSWDEVVVAPLTLHASRGGRLTRPCTRRVPGATLWGLGGEHP